MRSIDFEVDFLVVGGGVAGLRAAAGLAAAGRVLILTKAEPAESNTGYAQGGIAAAVGADDSAALHGADTIRAGDGLCDEEAVRVLVEHGAAGVRELIEWGARFERHPDAPQGDRQNERGDGAARAQHIRRHSGCHCGPLLE